MIRVEQPQVPDVMGVKIGYRTFMCSSAGALSSLTNGIMWEPRKRHEARCVDSQAHRWFFMSFTKEEAVGAGHIEDGGRKWAISPAIRCTCGIYAYKELKGVEDHVADLSLHHTHQAVAYGEIKLWGKVIECQAGYRAQYAYPQKLKLTNGTEALARAVEQLYCVPVELISQRKDEIEIEDTTFENFWRSPRPTIYFSPSHKSLAHYYGLVTGSPKPPSQSKTNPFGIIKGHVVSRVKSRPTIYRANPRVVRPNRWQLKQYGNVDVPAPIYGVPWQMIMRGILYKNPLCINQVDYRTTTLIAGRRGGKTLGV